MVQSAWAGWLIVIASVFYKMKENETAPATGKIVMTIAILIFISAAVPSLL